MSSAGLPQVPSCSRQSINHRLPRCRGASSVYYINTQLLHIGEIAEMEEGPSLIDLTLDEGCHGELSTKIGDETVVFAYSNTWSRVDRYS